MSKPSSAKPGSCFSTPFSPPQERGNSSYQLPNRARSRSTSMASGCSERDAAVTGLDALDCCEQLGPECDIVLGRLRDVGIGKGVLRVVDQRPVGFLGRRLYCRRAGGVRPLRARRRGRAVPRRPCARARRARCRTRRSTPRRCTPSGLPGRHRSCRPSGRRLGGRRSAPSRPRAVCVVCGGLYRTTARRRSWPSRKMSASTVTVSPTQRLAG